MIPTGWRIREGRELIGLSQADLAEAAGVEFAREDSGPGVRLRKAGQTDEASSR